jgi:glyoxylase-like metal-dependent hydrolase (beta-lactamase superfamily II)
MRIHHLNCISACPLGGFLMDGLSVGAIRARLATHCLLLEAAGELVLVDTGYGLRDVANPKGRLSKFFLALNRPELRQSMTAARQIEALGFRPRDVRHIVLSHLDFDHAGGLDDFPEATVHLLAEECRSAVSRRTTLDRMRYRPQQWSSMPRWQCYPTNGGEPWMGFDRARQLKGLGPDILLVPLIGHTLGHAGVAIRGPDGWLFYAADAYFYHAEMDPDRPRCTPGLRLYQKVMEKDRRARLLNQRRLRALKRTRGDEVEVFCAHDVRELERLSGRSHREPIGVRNQPGGRPHADHDRFHGPRRPVPARG